MFFLWNLHALVFFEKKHIILKEERIQKEAPWTRSPQKHKHTERTRQQKKKTKKNNAVCMSQGKN